MGDRDDVAAPQPGQRVVDRLATLQSRRAGLSTLLLTDLLAQPGVFEDGSIVSTELGGGLVEQVLAALHAADDFEHVVALDA